MEQQNNNSTIDTFYGFWKYLGVMGVFLIGLVLFWWGLAIILSGQWVEARTAAGPFGSMVLAPLGVGMILTWLSFVEFIRIIREN